jgi:hypothetical protein
MGERPTAIAPRNFPSPATPGPPDFPFLSSRLPIGFVVTGEAVHTRPRYRENSKLP